LTSKVWIGIIRTRWELAATVYT